MNNWDSRIIDLWSNHYHIPSVHFTTPGRSTYVYQAENDDHSATLLYNPSQSILAMPHHSVGGLTTLDDGDPLVPAALHQLLSPLRVHVLEEVLVYYWRTTAPTPMNPPAIRPLSVADTPLIRRFQAACTPRDLQLGQIEPDDPVVVGYFVDDQLAGIGSLLYWGYDIADIGIISHPAYRKRGIGLDITAELVRLGLAMGKVMQYRTLTTNLGSLALANRLGFAHYMTIADLRVVPAPD